MTRPITYAALALLALSGCTRARTEAVVLVSTDGLRIPDDVDSVTLSVFDTSDPANFVFQQGFQLCGGAVTDGCLTLPLDFTLVPGAHRDHSSRVQVTATRAGVPVIDDAATFTFAEGVSVRLDFVLYGNCLGNVDCAARDQACGPDATCEAVPATPINGDPDLSVTPDLAAGPADLGATNGADLAVADLGAPADLGVADLSVPADLRIPADLRLPADLRTPLDFSNPSSDGGAADNLLTWTASSGYDSGTFYSVWGLSTTVYAVGDKGAAGNPIWKRPAAGTPLQFNVDSTNSNTATLRSVWGRSKSSIYAVGDSATLLALAGGTWSVVTGSGLPTAVALHGVWIGPPGSPTIWAVGGDLSGSCMDTADYNHFTTMWGTAYSSGLDCAFGGVWSDGAGGAVLAANASKIQYTTDDGATIGGFAFTVAKTNYLHGIWGASMNDVHLVGDNGVIYHWSLNGGSPMGSTETSNTTSVLRAIHGSSANDLWAVGGNKVLHSTGDGNWVAQTNLPNLTMDLYGVYAQAPNDVYVVGTVNGAKLIMHGQ